MRPGWGEEEVDVNFKEVKKLNDRSIVFVDEDGQEVCIGKQLIGNLEEIEDDWGGENPSVQSEWVSHVTIPAWLAVKEGYFEKEDFE